MTTNQITSHCRLGGKGGEMHNIKKNQDKKTIIPEDCVPGESFGALFTCTWRSSPERCSSVPGGVLRSTVQLYLEESSVALFICTWRSPPEHCSSDQKWQTGLMLKTSLMLLLQSRIILSATAGGGEGAAVVPFKSLKGTIYNFFNM